MKKNYKKQTFKTRSEWLANRGIGGSDAAAILNLSKWITQDDIYNRLVLNKEKEDIQNERMIEGTKAEDHIRALFELDNKVVVKCPPKKGNWIFKRTDYPLITCTPDGIFTGHDGNLYGLEIKDIELIRSIDKNMWEYNELPQQYFIQCLQYLVVINDLKGVVLNAHLKYFKKEEENWVFDYAVDKSYWVLREDYSKEIEYLEKKEKDFIDNNINKRKRPKTIIKL